MYNITKMVAELRILFNTYIYSDKNYIDRLISNIKNNTPAIDVSIGCSPSNCLMIKFNSEDLANNVSIFSGIYKSFFNLYQSIYVSGDLRRLINDKYSGNCKDELLSFVLSDTVSKAPVLSVWGMYNVVPINEDMLYVYL